MPGNKSHTIKSTLTYQTPLGSVSRSFLILLSFLLTVLIGMIRYVTGPELALSFFYLFPILIAAWYAGRWAGIVMSAISAVSWLVADLSMLTKFSSRFIPFVNETLRLMVFLVMAYMMSELKKNIDEHKKTARTDPLTNIFNRRAFFELAQLEINKAQRFRSPISMIFIDIDNFKSVNDTCGHQIGDQLLIVVAQGIKKQIRAIDVLARFGGDEFGILLPCTAAGAARRVAVKLRRNLLAMVEDAAWPVTFSIGLITYEPSPGHVNEIVLKADELMYLAKHEGKNTIRSDVIREG